MSTEPSGNVDPLFKYKNSPLQGVEAYRSPFYRRLLSAGYKGYLQGSLGGATLFAGLGIIAGTALTFGVASFIPGATLVTSAIAIPIMAGAGLLYGKDAFGTIGAMAAISAEQAELTEKRRGLLDRYYETPSNEEAKEIEKLLREQANEAEPKKLFHWKSGLLGAAVVATIAVVAISLAPSFGVFTTVGLAEGAEIIPSFAGKILTKLGVTALTATSAPVLLTAGAVGALIGAVTGIDRTYIRKWFDMQEYLHDDTSVKERKQEHQKSAERLTQAYKREGYVSETRNTPAEINGREAPISPRVLSPVGDEPQAGAAKPAAGKETPTTHVERVTHERMQQPAHMHLASL